jgi:hypothetical protein
LKQTGDRSTDDRNPNEHVANRSAEREQRATGPPAAPVHRGDKDRPEAAEGRIREQLALVQQLPSVAGKAESRCVGGSIPSLATTVQAIQRSRSATPDSQQSSGNRNFGLPESTESDVVRPQAP